MILSSISVILRDVGQLVPPIPQIAAHDIKHDQHTGVPMLCSRTRSCRRRTCGPASIDRLQGSFSPDIELCMRIMIPQANGPDAHALCLAALLSTTGRAPVHAQRPSMPHATAYTKLRPFCQSPHAPRPRLPPGRSHGRPRPLLGRRKITLAGLEHQLLFRSGQDRQVANTTLTHVRASSGSTRLGRTAAIKCLQGCGHRFHEHDRPQPTQDLLRAQAMYRFLLPDVYCCSSKRAGARPRWRSQTRAPFLHRQKTMLRVECPRRRDGFVIAWEGNRVRDNSRTLVAPCRFDSGEPSFPTI